MKARCLYKAVGAVVLVGLSAGGSEAATSPITRFMPPETHMAFWVDDISASREAALKNPMVQFGLDEEFGVGKDMNAITRALNRVPVASIDPLSTLWGILIPATDLGIRSGIEATTTVFQINLEEVLGTFEGGLAIYSTLYNLYEADGIEIVEWDAVIAGEVAPEGRQSAEDFLDRALRPIPADARRSMTNYFGVPVYRIEYFLETDAPLPGDPNSDLGLVEEIPVIVEYAWTENHLLLAEGRGRPLERSLRAYAENDARHMLTGQAAYQRVRRAMEPDQGGFHFYMDLAHHLREWRDFPSLRGVVRLATAVGLRGAGPILVNGRVDERGVELQAVIGVGDQPEGAFELLAESPRNALDGLELVPADSESFGTLSVDMLLLYRQIRAAQQVLQPAQRVATDAVLRAIEGLAGLQLERDLLRDARGEIVTYMRADGIGINGVPLFASGIILPLGNSTEAARVINGLLDQLSGPQMAFLDLDSSDFEGVRLWESPEETLNAMGGYGFHFAQTPAGFVSTNRGSELRSIVRRVLGNELIVSQKDQGTLDRLRDALASSDLRGFHYTRAGAVVEDMTRMGRRVPNLPPPELLRRSIGDTYWTLHAGDRHARVRLVLEAPNTSNP